ncbi:hypothetical protein KAR26_00650 [Candidatus Parcubacteria bacterium]|nr:hypothetical protein [Candidatus Parcubacteria bacterium]
MAEPIIEAKELIQDAHNISILLSDIQEDNLTSAIALFHSLKKRAKKAVILLPASSLANLQSLRIYKLLQPKNFVISIDTSQNKVSEIFYEKNEKNLKICLALSSGHIEEKNIDFSFLSFKSLDTLKEEKFDLLITLGVQNSEDLFKKQETPILNIDNHPDGKNFGKVNIREPQFSIAQTLIELINEMDKNIATPLLAGMIYFSIQRETTIQPKVFKAISYLIKKDGDIQKIIQHLKTETELPNNSVKQISQIRLLAKVLEKLDYDKDKQLYCAVLTNEDFEKLEASSLDLNFVITELKNAWHFPCLLVLWEDKTATKGVFYSPQPEAIKKILENFTGTLKGEGGIFLIQEVDLETAKKKILKLL